MRISQIEIENYRAHRDTIVSFDDLTVFIGRNGAGKSSILYAIDFFYDISAVLTREDIYAGADEEVTIKVTYADLSDEELDKFSLFVRDGALVVIKRARIGKPWQYYGIIPQLPEFAEIRKKTGAMDQRRDYKELIDSGRIPNLLPARTQPEILAAMDEFERDPVNVALLRPIERQQQFLGDRRAGGGSLDNFTSYVLARGCSRVGKTRRNPDARRSVGYVVSLKSRRHREVPYRF